MWCMDGVAQRATFSAKDMQNLASIFQNSSGDLEQIWAYTYMYS